MNETAKDILRPTPATVGGTLVIASLLHWLAVSPGIREGMGMTIEGTGVFWHDNLIEALPYLQTDNTFLKFLTFFVMSYALVWVSTAIFHLFDNTQSAVIKQLRKHG
jgi:hypothetical protein